MNIVIFGAGAIGSLFGALLSKKNNVVLIARKSHVDNIKRKGLLITGLTNKKINIDAFEKIEDLSIKPELVIITVKSNDTYKVIQKIKNHTYKNTIILSLQNGLNNIDDIKQFIDEEKIIAGITTHGVIFTKPGEIKHTGIGKTIIGELDGSESDRIKKISKVFCNSNIQTQIDKNIIKQIWIKAIINSSINPLTTIFKCKNGYLLENPILEKIVEKICFESTKIAKSENILVNYKNMIIQTKQVIADTSDNYSSMYQSIKKKKKTEIDSINGVLVNIGEKNNQDADINKILINLIHRI